MKRNLFNILQLFIVTAGILSCTGANLYKDLASNKESDEALYEDAQKLIDDGNYTAAIDKILSTTSDFRAEPRVKESLAGAYAARCGMEFIPFANNLTGGSAGGLFALAMNGFVGVDTANYADCKTAEGIIEGIGVVGERTQSQNLFLLILELAKMGNRIRSVADIDPVATGDGAVDAAFNCKTSVPIADAQEIIESFYKFLTQFTAVGSELSGLDSIQDFVDDYGGALPALDYSTNTPGADEMDAPIITIRTLLNAQSFGIGSCANADPTTCICPP